MITVKRNDLADAIATARTITNPRAHLPILSCVRITASSTTLTIAATNLDAHVEVVIPREAGAGVCDIAIPAGTLARVIGRGMGNTVLAVKGSKLHVNGSVIPGMAVTEFPPHFNGSFNVHVAVVAPDFVTMLTRVAGAASDDATTVVLHGVFMQREKRALRLAATDRTRLYMGTVAVEGSPVAEVSAKYIVDLHVVAALGKARPTDKVGIEATEDGEWLRFRSGTLTVTGRCVAGAFPNYGQVVRDTETIEATVDTMELLNAVIDASKAGASIAYPVGLIRDTKHNGPLHVTATLEDGGGFDRRMTSHVSPKWVPIHFNPRLLSATLAAVRSDSVSLGMENGLQPLNVTDEPMNGFRAVLMPVRVPS